LVKSGENGRPREAEGATSIFLFPSMAMRLLSNPNLGS
jgi:hypothetical protein